MHKPYRLDTYLLRALVNRIALKYFHQLVDSNCKITFNKLFRTSGGYFYVHSDKKFHCDWLKHNERLTLKQRLSLPHEIDYNPYIFQEYNYTCIVSLIKHELIHYFLWLHGYHNWGHSPRFKQILHDIGGSKWTPYRKNTYGYLYRCTYCDHCIVTVINILMIKFLNVLNVDMPCFLMVNIMVNIFVRFRIHYIHLYYGSKRQYLFIKH